ncbi:methyltransferase family protein [Candidatus Eisenbacteria bacterium]|uniref:Methyltransferase family protein n=1 Tax=Eiseniibacteriota bacterium TaxID=2212470 RepID=A0ABV6YLQ7_UNCEI
MKEKNGEHPFGDAGQLILLGLFLIVWIVDSFFLRISTLFAAYIPLYIRLIILGIGLAKGIYLARSAHIVVSREHRLKGVKTDGAFRFLRHPLYAAGLQFYFGMTFVTCSLLSLGLFVVIWIFYDYIAGYEEKLMAQKFGDEYRTYMSRTGKWIPRLWARS